MSESTRLKLIQSIEKKRNSRVIAYLTSFRPGLSHAGAIEYPDVRVIERHLRALNLKGAQNIDLFLYTPGGLAVVPWRLVTLIREYIGKGRFSTLIPSMAMSAGTKISLGADEIVMAPGGELGPIDTQMWFGVEDVNGYLELAESLGLKSQASKRETFRMLSEDVDPITLGEARRVMKESERVTLRILESRRRPLSSRQNKKIADYMIRKIGLHGQSIRRTEARKIGMNFVKNAEDFGVAEHMASLFDSYEDLMALDLPFARPLKSLMRGGMTGDENDFDVRGEHPTERPIAVVESVERLDIGKVAFGHRFWRDAPDTPEQKDDKKKGAPNRATAEHMSQEISWQVERGGDLPQKRKTFGPR